MDLDQLRAEFGVGTDQHESGDHAAYADFADRYSVDDDEDDDPDDEDDLADDDLADDEFEDEDDFDDEDEAPADGYRDAEDGSAGPRMSRATGA
jgi:hypothetical protein